MEEKLFKEIKLLLSKVIKKLNDSSGANKLSDDSISELKLMLNGIKSQMKPPKPHRAVISRQVRVKTYIPNISDELKSILEVKEFQIGSYKLDTTTRMLTRYDKSIKLTRKEMQLLAFLSTNKNLTVKRSDCLAVVWKDYSYRTARSMDVYICKIRKYLKDDDSINFVNIHGLGYKVMF